ncbi:MAG: hypothetical protein Fur0018_19720 [Anaerolineales bacterium]
MLFAALMGLVTVWCTAYEIEILSPSFAAKLLWTDVQFAAIALTPTAWLVFALAYSGQERWLTRLNFSLLLVIPILTIGFAFTNPLHHLMWQNFTYHPGISDLQNVAGQWFWVHTYYSYALILIGMGLYVRMYLHNEGLYRQQALIAMLGALFPFCINALYVFSLLPAPPLDITPLTFALSGLIFGWGLFRFHLLDIVPVARELVIENMPDGMFVVDEHGRMVDINPAMRHILGLLGSEQVIGRPAMRFLRPWKDLVRRYLRAPQAAAEVSVGSGNNRQWYDMRISPVRNRQGRPMGRVVVFRNITERKQVEEELRRANEEIRRFNEQLERMVQQRTEELQAAYSKLETLDRNKTDFIKVAAHELRTPLTVLKGYTQVLLQDPLLAQFPEKRDLLNGILSGEQRMHQVVNDLLDVSRIDTQAMKVAIEPVRLYDAVTRAFSLIAEDTARRKIAFSAEEIRALPIIHADPDLLRRAFYHLLTNAVKYTPDGGRVWVHGQVDEFHRQVEVLVSDTGIGIDPDALSMVFEKFYRTGEIALHSSGRTKFKGGGPGLGLAIVRGIIQAHGGRIWAESPGYDEETCPGSHFHILLPLPPETPR